MADELTHVYDNAVVDVLHHQSASRTSHAEELQAKQMAITM